VVLSERVEPYDHFVLDLDGCVWVGDEATAGAAQAIGALRGAGKRIVFVTNDPRRATEDYVAKLWSLGVRASVDDVVTVGGATQRLLHETRSGSTAFVIGTESMRRHVADAGLRVLNGTDLAAGAQVVVVAGTDHLGLDDLRIATLALRRGGDLVATSRDPTYPSADGLVPGTGALLAAVEYASGVTATIVGKPEPELFATALDRLGEGRTLAVGDSIDADVAAAAKAGVDAALVLTGGTTAEEAEEAGEPRPLYVADSLAELVLGGAPYS
jgi:HAD superfamily hydrolase (TIGR01450 family)